MGGILGPNLANIGTLIFDTPFVGIGWAFSFNGGTFMLNAINSEYKLRLQGLNAISIFGANLLASSSVGFVLASGGWEVLNLISFGFIVIFFILFYIFRMQDNL
ncbi:hypothetical protein [Campylobacter hyointestinalis]|uniref:hypothetical protein n=1 Tax=Campylobacter hyointestinalis TaxID=198 RepID=UPI00215726B2|nr:hypothetical protein [Campylobacter hyointestinalis]